MGPEPHDGTPAGVAFLGVVHNPLGAFLQYLDMVIYDGIRMYDGISWDVHGCTYSMMNLRSNDDIGCFLMIV